MNVEKDCKVNSKFLEALETVVKDMTSPDISVSKDDYDNKCYGQISIACNKNDYNNHHRDDSITQCLEYDSYIKKEKNDYPKDIMKIDTEEDQVSCKWLTVEKSEDVKSIISVVPLSEAGCGSRGIEPATVELNGMCKETGCDKHRVYNPANIIKYDNDIKEETIDTEDSMMDVDKYPHDKMLDNEDFEWVEVTREDGTDPTGTVRLYQCKLCEYNAKIKNSLVQHFRVKHDENPKWYQCQFCEYRTKLKSNLTRHSGLRHSDAAEWYQCGFCEYRTKLKGSLTRHSKLRHGIAAEWYQCNFCEFRTKHKSSLKVHFKCKHDTSAEWYECYCCEYKAKTKARLREHTKIKHKATSAEWHFCQLCEYKTKYKSNLWTHFKNKHDQGVEWHHCVLKTKNKDNLESHSKYKHDISTEVSSRNDIDSSGSAKLYQCKFCEYKAKNKSTFYEHCKVKHDESAKWYQCHLCEYKTKLKIALTRHFTRQHDASAEWYECKLCKFRTKSKYSLKHHFTRKHDIG